jgi:hypothetical protein
MPEHDERVIQDEIIQMIRDTILKNRRGHEVCPIAIQEGITEIFVKERLEFVESPTVLDTKFPKISKSVLKSFVGIFLKCCDLTRNVTT